MGQHVPQFFGVGDCLSSYPPPTQATPIPLYSLANARVIFQNSLFSKHFLEIGLFYQQFLSNYFAIRTHLSMLIYKNVFENSTYYEIFSLS